MEATLPSVLRIGFRVGSALALLLSAAAAVDAAGKARTEGLATPADFRKLPAGRTRSVAIFEEMAKVLTHPRCVNCHPSGIRPLQGEEGRPHEPTVVRGRDGLGMVGMRCSTCHGAGNDLASGIPGEPHWKLAPASMAWAGRTVGAICRQITDPARNGGRSKQEIAEHLAKDPLVAWAWSPGGSRSAPPGSQVLLGNLARAWVEHGGHCPGD